MAQKVIKTGNSLAVTIPSEFVKIIGVRAGDGVKLEVEPGQAKISYLFFGTQQLPLSENFLKIKDKRNKRG